MRRKLGIFETAATLSNDHAPFVVVVVVQVDGGPTPDRLRAALDVLQRRHPPLRVRIVERSGRFRYEPEGTPQIPLRLVERADAEHWRGVAEDELGERIDSETGPLLRCTYLRPTSPGDGSEIVLAFHHAIMDAASGATLLAELLELCRDGADRSADTEAPTLPPVEELFPRDYRGIRGRARALAFLVRQLGDEVVFRFRTRGVHKPPVAERYRCRVLPTGLSRRETADLVRRTRRRRVTIAGALSAAFLLAVRRRLYDGGEATDRPPAMRYMTFADLRPYLSRTVPSEALGSMISMLRYTTRVESPVEDGLEDGSTFWPFARRITDQVAAGFRRGDKYCALLLAATMMRQVVSQRSRRMAATAISYGGALRSADLVGGGAEARAATEEGGDRLSVRGMRAFVANFEVGPEYTAQARILDGALQLDVVYLDSDMDAALAETIAEDILEILRAAGRNGGGGE